MSGAVSEHKRSSVMGYQLSPERGHINAPDAWMVIRHTVMRDADDEPIYRSDMLAHGIPLQEALDQIALDQVGYGVATTEGIGSHG